MPDRRLISAPKSLLWTVHLRPIPNVVLLPCLSTTIPWPLKVSLINSARALTRAGLAMSRHGSSTTACSSRAKLKSLPAALLSIFDTTELLSTFETTVEPKSIEFSMAIARRLNRAYSTLRNGTERNETKGINLYWNEHIKYSSVR